MARLCSSETLSEIARRLFQAAGAPPETASAVATELVTSSLMGHDSHGFLRVPEYLDAIERGEIRPTAKITIERTSESTAVVDCAHGFGAMGARVAIDEAISLAKQRRVACVVTNHCNHVGRLGAYPQRAAQADCVAIATCCSPMHGHCVLPWGGRAGRLATNPIAYGVPKSGDPILCDISTSVAPEGKVRFYRNEGKPTPPGWILDSAGNPTTVAADFYGPPRGGILPLGGAAGHKGYALSLLVELFGSALAGMSTTDATRRGNGVCFIVLDPSAFCPLEQFKALVDETVAYVKSSPPLPGVEEVLVPGEVEFRSLRRRLIEGASVDQVTWAAIEKHAERLKTPLPDVEWR